MLSCYLFLFVGTAHLCSGRSITIDVERVKIKDSNSHLQKIRLIDSQTSSELQEKLKLNGTMLISKDLQNALKGYKGSLYLGGDQKANLFFDISNRWLAVGSTECDFSCGLTNDHKYYNLSKSITGKIVGPDFETNERRGKLI